MSRTVLFSIVLFAVASVPLWAGDLDHRAHIKEHAAETGCVACHLPGAASIVPETKVCVKCHNAEMVAKVTLPATKTHGPVWALNHRAAAKDKAIDCFACHKQSDCLDCHKAGFAHEQGDFSNNMINVHRSDFNVSHPLAARTDQTLCFRCHEAKFCNQCHDAWRLRGSDIGSPSHRRSFELGFEGADFETIHAGISSSLQCDQCHLQDSVAPDFHTWSIGHAREARRSLATCQACHPDGDVCLRCHSARSGALGFNPHPEDWDKIKHNIDHASSGKTCRKCH